MSETGEIGAGEIGAGDTGAGEIGASETGGDDSVDRLGPQIRALRHARSLTLAQLAERTELSTGHISQVERGLSTPTIRQLQAIATAMGVRIGWFFDGGGAQVPDGDGVVVRAAQRKVLRMEGLGLTDYLLVPDLDRQLELLLCELAPGAGSGEEPYTHEGEEAGIVLAGQLELWVAERRYVLEEGDSFAFSSTQPHRYRNIGAARARVVWAITPPTF